ncbi:MAG: prepilin-type N-terminal cleavage/methylation domain-containing protein [Phycisphaerae bacterium]|nr:prepilin-type N-terminal cleavage/methylation domain-containing protein [Phycisphaerae bacterium]
MIRSTRNVHVRRRPRRRGGGFTLVEALLAAVILAVAVLAISEAIVAGQQQAHAAMNDEQGMMMCEELMEQMMAMPHFDGTGGYTLGAEAPETDPSFFDSLDDYHGLMQTPGNCVDANNIALPDQYNQYTRSITMVQESKTVTGLGDPISGLNVTVTIMDRRGQTWTLERFFPAPL